MTSDGVAARNISSTNVHAVPVGDGHVLHVQTSGSPHGVPAVFLHGGPGSGSQPEHRSLFDLERFYLVQFDQRGAGRSTPARARGHNTTRHLIADMEVIRETLEFERWLVVGGSWGATLALAYAQAHPERVQGLVLRATFLGTRAELDWAFGTGLRTFHPQLYADFLKVLPEPERGDPLGSYWRRILDPDPLVHIPAARAWHDTERALSSLQPNADRLDQTSLDNSNGPLPATPFMEAHYFSNGCFLKPDQLMRDAGRLAGIPGRIVQGRYDLLCPPSTSHALAERWPNAHVEIVEAAGHSGGEAPVANALRAAITRFASR